MITLRDDQTKAVEDMRTAFTQGHQSVLFRAPCRFGKTVVAAYMAQQSTLKRRLVIFACHRDAILVQTAATFERFGIKHGFIASGRPSNPFALAQVASADTLRNRLYMLKDCALLVVDEGHLWNSKTRKQIIDAAKEAGAKIVILTATPVRLDGKPLSDIADVMVLGPTEAELIERGSLARYRAYAPVRPELEGLPTRMGDYVQAEVEERLDRPSIVGDAVSTWQKYALGLRTVVYAISRAHGRHVLEAYTQAGIAAGYIDGETPKAEQRRIAHALADGSISVIVSVDLLTTGFDLASLIGRDVSIQCVQLLRPTKSLQLAIQMMMRCMTAQEGEAVILDHVNMIMNRDGTVHHGFPDDDREWSLEGRSGKRVEGGPSFDVKQCESCFAAYRAHLSACPHCSSERVVRERKVDIEEGELAEIHRKAVQKVEMRSARDLDSVARVAASRGYKPAWIHKRMASIGKPVSFSKAMEAAASARQ